MKLHCFTVLYAGLWPVHLSGHGGALHPWTGAVIHGLWVAEILQGLLILSSALTTAKYLLSFSPSVLGVLLCPLALYYRLWQRVCVRLEPALQWLDFSAKGYMMLKPIDNQCKYTVDLYSVSPIKLKCTLNDIMLKTDSAFLELYFKDYICSGIWRCSLKFCGHKGPLCIVNNVVMHS